VYWPEFNVNTIGNMEPGKGYQVRMVSDRVFNFPSNDITLPQLRTSSQLINKYYSTPKAKEMSMNIALPLDVLSEFVIGDELAVKNKNNEVLATTVFNNQSIALTIWINEEDLGSEFNLFHWSNETKQEIEVSINTVSTLLENNSVVIVDAISTIKSQNTFAVYPNPSSDKATVKVSLANETLTSISLYNILGEQVMVIANTVIAKGVSTVDFDVENITTGVYFIKLTSDTFSEVKRFQVR